MAERSLTFGPFRLDVFQNRLWQQEQPIALRPQALAMLRYLMLHANRLATKAELLQHVWGGRQVTDTVLRGCIHAIRVALADTADTPRYLETVGQQGYQFRLGRAATYRRPAEARPVVGRQGEVEWLRERWLWAREGRRQCCMLSGEAGIGKTTVVDLIVASLPTPYEVGIGRGQCVDIYGEGESYLPLLEALGQARDLAGQCYALVQGMHNHASLVESLRLLGNMTYLLGDSLAAREYYEQGLALYHRLTPSASSGFNLGPRMVSCLSWLALVVWQLGYPDQARQRSAEALTLVQAHPHALESVTALNATARLHHCRRDVTAVSDYVTRALAQELGFPLLHSSASQIQGWVVAVQGDPTTGLAQLQQGAMQTTDTFVMKPYFLALQVEVYGMLQQYEAALHLLTDILRRAQAAERHFYDAELYRLQGELLLAQAGPRHQEEAEASLRQALDVARRQAAKMWELRAAVSLSRLWQHQGKSAEARSLLSPLYGWFTDGHETAALQAARAVLEGLS